MQQALKLPLIGAVLLTVCATLILFIFTTSARAQEVAEAPVVEAAPALPEAEPAPAQEPEAVVETEEPAAVVEEEVPAESVTEASSAPALAPILSTGKEDYHPGETASIFGSLFSSLQNIVLKIFGSDDNNQNYTEETQTVEADADGSFEASYTLDDLYRPFYEVYAYDTEGEELASTWFRDSSVSAYDQCQNDDGDGYVTGDTGCRWTTGNLIASNSTYHEGDSTVQRLWVEGFVPGSPHTVTFKYGTTKGGKHAYDFLTTYDASEAPITLADICQDITGCTSAGLSTLAIPMDSNVPDSIEAGTRDFTMRGGSLVSATNPTIVSGSYAGDSETSVTVSFTVAASGDMCSTKKVQGQNVTSCGVALFFGAHVSEFADWNAPTAVSIPGSPYHVSLDAIDGASAGQRDNQMQADAIVVPTTATLTLVKNVVNDNGGTATAGQWTLAANGAGSNDISGASGSENVTNAEVDAGTFALSESAGPAGYTGGTYSCVKNNEAPVVSNSITLAVGDVATCTITKNHNAQVLHLRKVVTNNSGGTATAADFTLSANGADSNDLSGTSPVDSGAGLKADTFTLSESGPSGYAASSWVCVGGTQNGVNITLGLGQSATCTIINDDIQPKLTVTKVVVNNNGGNAVVADFPLFVNAGAVVSGVQNGFNAGNYTVSETNLAGYTAGDWGGDCAADGSITLAPGDVKACTITNDDQPAHVILNKVVTKDNGGSAGINDFGLSVGGAEVASGEDKEVNSNISIALDEAGLAGYSFVSITGDTKCPAVLGGTVTLNEGETVTCTIINDDIAPVLHLRKVVINDNGGNAADTAWTLTAEGAGSNDVVGTTPVDSGATLMADTFALSESGGPAGYAASAWSCVGGTQNGVSVTLAVGQEATCTITNDDIAPQLTVIKTVINDNGGNADAGDFTMNVTGTDVSTPSFPGSESGTVVTLDAGAYSVDESVTSGYIKTLGVECSGTIAIGETKTCTITNNDTPGHFTGGGSIFPNLADGGFLSGIGKNPKDTRVTHGFTLHCDASVQPNRLEVNWGPAKNAQKFHLESLTTADCSDNSLISPQQPNADFDTIMGTGVGRFNGVSGATIQFTFDDAGEPGRNDSVKMLIKDKSGATVLNTGNSFVKIDVGNQQAHQDN